MKQELMLYAYIYYIHTCTYTYTKSSLKWNFFPNKTKNIKIKEKYYKIL